eukprot:2182822-Rhodomonas_salina.1
MAALPTSRLQSVLAVPEKRLPRSWRLPGVEGAGGAESAVWGCSDAQPVLPPPPPPRSRPQHASRPGRRRPRRGATALPRPHSLEPGQIKPFSRTESTAEAAHST